MIKIAHLYYDLMNLYGDNGNIKALKYHLEKQKLKVDIDFLTIGDNVDFQKYDLIYIGPGTYNNQKIVIKDLMKYKKEIKNFIDNDNIFLVTGNALELFGKYIRLLNDKKIKTLDIFNFESEEVELRLVGETVAYNKNLKKEIIGFQNRNSVIKNLSNPWLQIKHGIGCDINFGGEGINYKNFYGTYLIGPILVRNPELLEFLCKKLIINKKENFKFKKFNMILEKKAYNEYIKNHLKIEV